MVQSPVAAKSIIEFFERENDLSDYDFTEEEKIIVSGIRDVEDQNIKSIELKWLYLLSTNNPKIHLEINQNLLRALESKNISVKEACRAIAVICKYTASRWYELYDLGGHPLIILRPRKYYDVIECLLKLKESCSCLRQ